MSENVTAVTKTVLDSIRTEYNLPENDEELNEPLTDYRVKVIDDYEEENYMYSSSNGKYQVFGKEQIDEETREDDLPVFMKCQEQEQQLLSIEIEKQTEKILMVHTINDEIEQQQELEDDKDLEKSILNSSSAAENDPEFKDPLEIVKTDSLRLDGQFARKLSISQTMLIENSESDSNLDSKYESSIIDDNPQNVTSLNKTTQYQTFESSSSTNSDLNNQCDFEEASKPNRHDEMPSDVENHGSKPSGKRVKKRLNKTSKNVSRETIIMVQQQEPCENTKIENKVSSSIYIQEISYSSGEMSSKSFDELVKIDQSFLDLDIKPTETIQINNEISLNVFNQKISITGSESRELLLQEIDENDEDTTSLGTSSHTVHTNKETNVQILHVEDSQNYTILSENELKEEKKSFYSSEASSAEEESKLNKLSSENKNESCILETANLIYSSDENVSESDTNLVSIDLIQNEPETHKSNEEIHLRESSHCSNSSSLNHLASHSADDLLGVHQLDTCCSSIESVNEGENSNSQHFSKSLNYLATMLVTEPHSVEDIDLNKLEISIDSNDIISLSAKNINDKMKDAVSDSKRLSFNRQQQRPVSFKVKDNQNDFPPFNFEQCNRDYKCSEQLEQEKQTPTPVENITGDFFDKRITSSNEPSIEFLVSLIDQPRENSTYNEKETLNKKEESKQSDNEQEVAAAVATALLFSSTVRSQSNDDMEEFKQEDLSSSYEDYDVESQQFQMANPRFYTNNIVLHSTEKLETEPRINPSYIDDNPIVANLGIDNPCFEDSNDEKKTIKTTTSSSVTSSNDSMIINQEYHIKKIVSQSRSTTENNEEEEGVVIETQLKNENFIDEQTFLICTPTPSTQSPIVDKNFEISNGKHLKNNNDQLENSEIALELVERTMSRSFEIASKISNDHAEKTPSPLNSPEVKLQHDEPTNVSDSIFEKALDLMSHKKIETVQEESNDVPPFLLESETKGFTNDVVIEKALIKINNKELDSIILEPVNLILEQETQLSITTNQLVENVMHKQKNDSITEFFTESISSEILSGPKIDPIETKEFVIGVIKKAISLTNVTESKQRNILFGEEEKNDLIEARALVDNVIENALNTIASESNMKKLVCEDQTEDEKEDEDEEEGKKKKKKKKKNHDENEKNKIYYKKDDDDDDDEDGDGHSSNKDGSVQRPADLITIVIQGSNSTQAVHHANQNQNLSPTSKAIQKTINSLSKENTGNLYDQFSLGSQSETKKLNSEVELSEIKIQDEFLIAKTKLDKNQADYDVKFKKIISETDTKQLQIETKLAESTMIVSDSILVNEKGRIYENFLETTSNQSKSEKNKTPTKSIFEDEISASKQHDIISDTRNEEKTGTFNLISKAEKCNKEREENLIDSNQKHEEFAHSALEKNFISNTSPNKELRELENMGSRNVSINEEIEQMVIERDNSFFYVENSIKNETESNDRKSEFICNIDSSLHYQIVDVDIINNEINENTNRLHLMNLTASDNKILETFNKTERNKNINSISCDLKNLTQLQPEVKPNYIIQAQSPLNEILIIQNQECNNKPLDKETFYSEQFQAEEEIKTPITETSIKNQELKIQQIQHFESNFKLLHSETEKPKTETSNKVLIFKSDDIQDYMNIEESKENFEFNLNLKSQNQVSEIKDAESNEFEESLNHQLADFTSKSTTFLENCLESHNDDLSVLIFQPEEKTNQKALYGSSPLLTSSFISIDNTLPNYSTDLDQVLNHESGLINRFNFSATLTDNISMEKDHYIESDNDDDRLSNKTLNLESIKKISSGDNLQSPPSNSTSFYTAYTNSNSQIKSDEISKNNDNTNKEFKRSASVTQTISSSNYMTAVDKMSSSRVHKSNSQSINLTSSESYYTVVDTSFQSDITSSKNGHSSSKKLKNSELSSSSSTYSCGMSSFDSSYSDINETTPNISLDSETDQKDLDNNLTSIVEESNPKDPKQIGNFNVEYFLKNMYPLVTDQTLSETRDKISKTNKSSSHNSTLTDDELKDDKIERKETRKENFTLTHKDISTESKLISMIENEDFLIMGSINEPKNIGDSNNQLVNLTAPMHSALSSDFLVILNPGIEKSDKNFCLKSSSAVEGNELLARPSSQMVGSPSFEKNTSNNGIGSNAGSTSGSGENVSYTSSILEFEKLEMQCTIDSFDPDHESNNISNTEDSVLVYSYVINETERNNYEISHDLNTIYESHEKETPSSLDESESANISISNLDLVNTKSPVSEEPPKIEKKISSQNLSLNFFQVDSTTTMSKCQLKANYEFQASTAEAITQKSPTNTSFFLNKSSSSLTNSPLNSPSNSTCLSRITQTHERDTQSPTMFVTKVASRSSSTSSIKSTDSFENELKYKFKIDENSYFARKQLEKLTKLEQSASAVPFTVVAEVITKQKSDEKLSCMIKPTKTTDSLESSANTQTDSGQSSMNDILQLANQLNRLNNDSFSFSSHPSSLATSYMSDLSALNPVGTQPTSMYDFLLARGKSSDEINTPNDEMSKNTKSRTSSSSSNFSMSESKVTIATLNTSSTRNTIQTSTSTVFSAEDLPSFRKLSSSPVSFATIGTEIPCISVSFKLTGSAMPSSSSTSNIDQKFFNSNYSSNTTASSTSGTITSSGIGTSNSSSSDTKLKKSNNSNPNLSNIHSHHSNNCYCGKQSSSDVKHLKTTSDYSISHSQNVACSKAKSTSNSTN